LLATPLLGVTVASQLMISVAMEEALADSLSEFTIIHLGLPLHFSVLLKRGGERFISDLTFVPNMIELRFIHGGRSLSAFE